jgi:hypothetical protein
VAGDTVAGDTVLGALVSGETCKTLSELSWPPCAPRSFAGFARLMMQPALRGPAIDVFCPPATERGAATFEWRGVEQIRGARRAGANFSQVAISQGWEIAGVPATQMSPTPARANSTNPKSIAPILASRWKVEGYGCYW